MFRTIILSLCVLFCTASFSVFAGTPAALGSAEPKKSSSLQLEAAVISENALVGQAMYSEKLQSHSQGVDRLTQTVALQADGFEPGQGVRVAIDGRQAFVLTADMKGQIKFDFVTTTLIKRGGVELGAPRTRLPRAKEGSTIQVGAYAGTFKTAG